MDRIWWTRWSRDSNICEHFKHLNNVNNDTYWMFSLNAIGLRFHRPSGIFVTVAFICIENKIMISMTEHTSYIKRGTRATLFSEGPWHLIATSRVMKWVSVSRKDKPTTFFGIRYQARRNFSFSLNYLAANKRCFFKTRRLQLLANKWHRYWSIFTVDLSWMSRCSYRECEKDLNLQWYENPSISNWICVRKAW